MKKVPAGEFKARCLSLMDEIQATGEPIVITKRGRPVVKVVPASRKAGVFGFMAGEFKITGDVESPPVPLSDWKVAKQ